MNPSFKTTVKKLLKKYGIQPSKQLGQNFLVDRGAIRKIIANFGSGGVALEIGPGIGSLTRELAKKAKRVVAVEKDTKMCKILRETLKDYSNIKIVNEDILKYKMRAINYKILGNLPFYLTAPVIRKFLELENKPQLMVLVVQKEVAQRICSNPPKMSLLAVSVRAYSTPEIISYLSRKSFWPQPKVDAAIIKIVPRPPLIGDRKLFFKIVKAGFSQPRKQLINNLSRGLKMDKEKVGKWLLENKVRPSQRAETLSAKDWQELLTSWEKYAKMKR